MEQLFVIVTSQIALQIDFLSFCKGKDWGTEREGGLPKDFQQARVRGPSRSPFSAAWFCLPVPWWSSVITGKQKSSSESISQLLQ